MRTLHVPRVALVSVLSAVVLSCAVSAFLSWRHFEGRVLDANAVGLWHERLGAQRATLDELSTQAQAELLQVGQQLAGMEARLLRMEALGQRVSEMAQLDKGEFRFDEPAALGGPAPSAQPAALIPTDYMAKLQRLASSLKTREQELNVLEALLARRRFLEQVAPSGWPVASGWISSGYGQRVDPFSGRPAWHAGVDFAGRAGSNVIAVAGGVVTFAGPRDGYGLLVEVHHGENMGTRYGHAKRLHVKVGDVVKKGQTIAEMGNTGRSTGHHVHFEVLREGRQINPAQYLARR